MTESDVPHSWMTDNTQQPQLIYTYRHKTHAHAKAALHCALMSHWNLRKATISLPNCVNAQLRTATHISSTHWSSCSPSCESASWLLATAGRSASHTDSSEPGRPRCTCPHLSSRSRLSCSCPSAPSLSPPSAPPLSLSYSISNLNSLQLVLYLLLSLTRSHSLPVVVSLTTFTFLLLSVSLALSRLLHTISVSVCPTPPPPFTDTIHSSRPCAKARLSQRRCHNSYIHIDH